jgi:hypothetical protein
VSEHVPNRTAQTVSAPASTAKIKLWFLKKPKSLVRWEQDVGISRSEAREFEFLSAVKIMLGL